jgi:hypothetical protein
MSGCVKIIATPSETMKIPEYSKADKIFNEYKVKLRENAPPKNLLKFLRKNIGKFNQSAADIAVIRVIELQKKQLDKHEEKLLDKEYLSQLKNIGDGEIHDISDKKVRDWAIDLQENNYIIRPTEIEINYKEINKIADKYVSEELKDYIKIESEESSTKYSSEDALDFHAKNTNSLKNYISNLAEMLDKTFKYTDNYSDSPYIVRVKQLKQEYLDVFLFGSPNNSAFLYYRGNNKPGNKVNSLWQKTYISIKNKYTKNSGIKDAFGVFIENYCNSLSKSNGLLKGTLYTEIDDLMKSQ